MGKKIKYRTKTWLSKVTKCLCDCLFDCCFIFFNFSYDEGGKDSLT